MMNQQAWAWSVVAVSALALGGEQSSAALVAGDSFLSGPDAAAGQYIHNKAFDLGGDPQNPTVPGFTGAWNNGGTGLFRPISDGLTAPGLTGSGGSALFQFDTEVGLRNVKRNLTSPPVISTGGEYWMAGLIRLNENDPDFDGFVYAGFASDLNDSNSTQGYRIGVAGDGSEMDLVLRHRSGAILAENVVLADGITPGDTHMVLIRALANTDQGGAGVPGNDNVSIWLNPTSTVSLAALGVPDFSIEDFALFTNTAFSALTFEGSNITGAGVQFDELRLATSFEGLQLAAAVIIPEPATATLALLGMAGLMQRRRLAK